jgi:hypothetical protein
MVDREFVARQRDHGDWSYSSGRTGYGCRGWIEVEIEVEDESVSHTELELSIDNKWSLWSRWGLDGGYDFVELLFKCMPIGSKVTTELACWKEIRYGSFSISRVKKGWTVHGEMHTLWDDESETRLSFYFTRRSVKHVMQQLDLAEDKLLAKDKRRSEIEPMSDDDESDID